MITTPVPLEPPGIPPAVPGAAPALLGSGGTQTQFGLRTDSIEPEPPARQEQYRPGQREQAGGPSTRPRLGHELLDLRGSGIGGTLQVTGWPALEHPCENERDREAQQDDDRDRGADRGRQLQPVGDQLGDLEDDEAHGPVRRGDTEHPAPLELGEEPLEWRGF